MAGPHARWKEIWGIQKDNFPRARVSGFPLVGGPGKFRFGGISVSGGISCIDYVTTVLFYPEKTKNQQKKERKREAAVIWMINHALS